MVKLLSPRNIRLSIFWCVLFGTQCFCLGTWYLPGKLSIILLWATTQNTTTTHNNQHELLPPYPPAALPSTSINVATSAMTADLGTATLYGSVALGAGLGQTRGEHDWEGSNPTSNSTSSDPAQNRCYFIEFFGVFQAGFEVGLGLGSFLRVRAQRYTVILILNSILPQTQIPQRNLLRLWS